MAIAKQRFACTAVLLTLMCTHGEAVQELSLAVSKAQFDVKLGAATESAKNAWGDWSTCPEGYKVLGLGEIDQLDQTGSIQTQDVNHFQCTDQGCRAWCAGSGCKVRALCGNAPGLEVESGTKVTSSKDQWGEFSVCKPGWKVIGLEELDLTDQTVGIEAQDLNHFRCEDSGCRAWCSGSDCTVVSRCAKAPNLQVVTGAAVLSGRDNWGAHAKCPTGFSVLGLAEMDLRDQTGSIATQDVNHFQCKPGEGCRAWCSGSDCTVISRCATLSPGPVNNFLISAGGFDTMLGKSIISGKNQWGSYSECPEGYKVLGLGEIDQLDHTGSSVRTRDVNHFQCTDQGCRSWCTGADCHVRTMCGRAPGLEVKSGTKVTSMKDGWGAFSTCPEGYQALGLEEMDLMDQSGGIESQDVNHFQCNDMGCRAWCSGSECTVVSRCAKAPGLTVKNGPGFLSAVDRWGWPSPCPEGFAVLGMGELDLLDQTGSVETQDVNHFQCSEFGCRAWCSGSQCGVLSRCASVTTDEVNEALGFDVTLGLLIRSQKDSWGQYSTCPDGYEVLGLGEIDEHDETGIEKQDVNHFQCTKLGCRAWCTGSGCTVRALCGRAPGLQMASGTRVDSQKDQWGAHSTCPSGYQVVGLEEVDLQDQSGGVESQDVNHFQCSDSGCRAWCSGSNCTVVSRCAKAPGLAIVSGKSVHSAKNRWGVYARCPHGHVTLGMGEIDLRDQTGSIATQDVNHFQCNSYGCRSWCSGSDCTVVSRCATLNGSAFIKTTLGTTIAMTLNPISAVDDVAVAKEMAKNHTDVVMPFLKEEHLDDTSIVTRLLEKLAKKSEAVKKAKSDTDSPDTALDDCMVLENTTLAAWRQCNYTRSQLKLKKEADCKAQADASPGVYTIKESKFDLTYTKKEGSSAPMATCNFETFKLEGTDEDCNAFVSDIIEQGKDEFTADYDVYTDAEAKCLASKDAYEKKIKDCIAAEEAYYGQQASCVKNETQWQVMVCKFQTALKNKCTTLKQFYAAVEDLVVEEKKINDEIRAVSYSKCLLDTYVEQNGTCFKTSVADHCTSMVNGASEEYATAAAETIHGFRESAKTHIQEFACEATSYTIGTNGKSYEKLDAAEEFSYFVKKGPSTFSASAVGELTPPPSAVC